MCKSNNINMKDTIKSFDGHGSAISGITLDESLISHRTRQRQDDDIDSMVSGITLDESLTSHRRRRREEEDSLIVVFLHFLLKYLKRENHLMFCHARLIIAECAMRNEGGEDEGSSLTGAIKYRLRNYVGEEFWREAIDSFVGFVELKMRQADIENTVIQYDLWAITADGAFF